MAPELLTTPRRRVRALGVHVDALTLREAVDVVVGWLDELIAVRGAAPLACRYVVTPNLDHAVLLDEREDFREAYAGAALVLPDGAPLLWAAKLRGDVLPERVAGSDLGPQVLRSAPNGTRVFLLGASDESSLEAKARLERDYRHLVVAGRLSPPFGFEKSESESRAILEAIRASRAELVIVGLGAPKQELWVHRERAELAGTVVLCLGATIDFLAGKKRRAPVWMQKSGLEWLHRAASEPRRLAGRYAKDALRLPGLLLRDRRAP